MLPSLGGRGGGGISNGQTYHTAPSSSSSSPSPSKSSSTSSSSPSPFSPYTRTMEEVWKEINLSSTHHHHHHHHLPLPLHHPTSSTPTAMPTFRSIILQDFLNTTTTTTRPTPSTATPTVDRPSCFGFPPPSTPPPPPTVLSLNSTPEFHFLDTPHADHHLHTLPVPNFNAPFDAFASTPFLCSFGKKRFPEEAENVTVDRRHKRMIKNRESAARSRARKQELFSPAYINELELEVANLVEENARLRRQQEQQQLCQAPPIAAAAQLPKKRHGLQRTSTAPF